MYNAGLLPVYKAGFIDLNKQYLTIGLNGLNQAAEFLGIKCNDNKDYKEFCQFIFSTVKEQNLAHKTTKTTFNTEQVPAESLAVKNYTDGKSPNYKCEANTKNDPTTAQVAINTDVDMAYSKPDGSFEYLGFNEINFNGNSSEEATNLQQSTEEVPEFDILKGGDILEDGDTHTLRIKGTRQGTGAFNVKDNITMNFENLYKEVEDNVEPYECTINSTTPFILNCDTSKHSIRTSPQSLHLSSGVMNISVTQSRRAEVTVKQKLLMIEMKEPNNTYTYEYYTTGSNAKYRKKSSGLSGGAIAGIVIACVVVLVAASIAAIMLRKPSPPIDNSTVVGLKSTDNI